MPESPTTPLGGCQGHLCLALSTATTNTHMQGSLWTCTLMFLSGAHEQSPPPLVQDRHTQPPTLVPWQKGQLLCELCQEGDNLRKSCEVGPGTSMTSVSQIWGLTGTAPVSWNIPDSRLETQRPGRAGWLAGGPAPGKGHFFLASSVIVRCRQLNSRVLGPGAVSAVWPVTPLSCLFCQSHLRNRMELLVLRVQFLTCERRSVP